MAGKRSSGGVKRQLVGGFSSLMVAASMGCPARYHVKLGRGKPVAVQGNTTVPPVSTSWSAPGPPTTVGGSTVVKKGYVPSERASQEEQIGMHLITVE